MDRRQVVWLASWAALTVVAVVVYRGIFGISFLNEDFMWLWYCRLRSWHDVWPLLATDIMAGKYSWRPLAQLSFAVNQALFGLHAPAYRFEVLAWHLIAAGAVMRIGARLSSPATGAVAALLFAVHPLQVESLAWASARSGPMATAFASLAALVHISDRSGSRTWLIGLLFALALGAQESAIVLLPLLVALDLLVPGWRPALRRYLALVLIGVVAGVLRWAAGPPGLAIPFAAQQLPDLGARILLVAGKLATAAGMILTLPVAAAVPVFVLGLIAALRRWRRGEALALYGLVWVALGLAPYLGFLLGPFPRYFHLPLAGAGLAFADLGVAAWRALPRRGLAVVLLAVLLGWTVRMVVHIEAALDVYRQRSAVTRTFLDDLRKAVPQAAAGSTFAFYRVGELRARQGLFVYGLDEAVRLLYNDGSLRVVFPELGKGEGVTYHLIYADGHLHRLSSGS